MRKGSVERKTVCDVSHQCSAVRSVHPRSPARAVVNCALVFACKEGSYQKPGQEGPV